MRISFRVLIISFFLTILGFLGFGSTTVNSFDNFESFGSMGDMSGMQSTTSGIFGSIGLFAIGGFMGTLGFGLTAAGAIVMFIAHRREITAYTTQQVMPVAQEGIEKMTPTVANAAGSIAQEIAKGIKDGLNDEQNK